MNTILKRINIENFRSRNNSNHWAIDENGLIANNSVNWSKIPMDIIIDDDSELNAISNILPLIYGIKKDSNMENIEFTKERNVFPYTELIKWYHFLREFARNCVFYKKCQYNGSERWVKKHDIYFFDFEDVDYFEIIPKNNSNIEYGTVIGINSSADTFNTIFRHNNKRYEKVFIELVEKVNNSNYDKISIPYINIPFYIEDNINSNGQFQQYSKIWSSKEIYRVGDIVIWFDENGVENTYILKRGNGYELVNIYGEFYKIISKNEGDYYEIISIDNFDGSEYYRIVNGVTKKIIVEKVENNVRELYYPVETYQSVFDEDLNDFIFDSPDEKGYHWELYIDNSDSNFIDFSENAEHIVSAKTESRLSNVRRSKKSVDDDGNILPFIIDFSGNTDTELTFITGPNSITINNDGNIYSDVINCITVSEDNNNEGIEINYISGNTYNVNKWYTVILDSPIKDKIKLTENDNSELLFYKKKDKYYWDCPEGFYQKPEPTEGVTYKFYEPHTSFRDYEMKHLPSLDGSDVYDEYFVKHCKNGGVAYGLLSEERRYVYDENWNKVQNEDGTFKVEIIKCYSDYFCENLQATLYYSGVTNSIIETSIDTEGNEFITNKIDPINYINTSFMQYSNPKFINNNGKVNFTYTLGAIVEYENNVNTKENDITILKNSGIKYNEVYNYKIEDTFINYVPSDIVTIDDSRFKLLNVKEEDIRDFTVIDITDESIPKLDRNNVGIVYKNAISENNIKYYRCLCKYNYINIDYDSSITTIINSDNGIQNNVLLSDIEYGGTQVIEDGFLKSYIYKDERLNDIENIHINAEIDIDRGMSSAFERMHILSEVKTFEDLENYRNNLFSL